MRAVAAAARERERKDGGVGGGGWRGKGRRGGVQRACIRPQTHVVAGRVTGYVFGLSLDAPASAHQGARG